MPEMIADYACRTGEGCLWHSDEQALYWVDIPRGRLFRYEPESGQHGMVFEHDEAIGGFTIQRDGALLLFMARGAVAAWRDGTLTPVLDGIEAERNSRFNDVIADPEGRVFAGTMSGPDGPGSLYRFDTHGTWERVAEGLGTPNGMGFTPDCTGMYFTDTRAAIYRCDYDRATGALTERQVVVEAADCAPGRPDGMTVDADGNLWSAMWDGGCVIQFAPDGSMLQRIPVPAKKASCATFAGPDYTDLYVTTAGGDRKDTDGEHAGALFRLQPGAAGRPEFRSAIPV